MAFVPKLPTFNVTVEVWQYQLAEDYWEETLEELPSQVYTQLRTQDGDAKGTLYLEYAKENDWLRDYVDYGNIGKTDAVVIRFPTTEDVRYVGYWVRDVQPRWLGFPNEHIMATLEKMTPDELNEVITSEPPPEPPDVVTLNSTGFGTSECEDCTALSTSHLLDLFSYDGNTAIWKTTQDFDCVEGFTEIDIAVAYVRGSSILSVTMSLVGGATIAQWFRDDLVDWDYSTGQNVDLTFGTEDCPWTILVNVSPPA